MSQGAGASLTYPALSKQKQKHFVGKRAEMRDLYGLGRLHTRHCIVHLAATAKDIVGFPGKTGPGMGSKDAQRV